MEELRRGQGHAKTRNHRTEDAIAAASLKRRSHAQQHHAQLTVVGAHGRSGHRVASPVERRESYRGTDDATDRLRVTPEETVQD
jgi:hypothetical protein